MNDREYRISLTFGLIWLVAGLYGMLGQAVPSSAFILDNFYFALLASTTVWGLLFLFIWRTYISWESRNIRVTTILSLFGIAQIALWKPLIHASLIWSNWALIIVTQAIVAPGLWATACCVLWWSRGTLRSSGQTDFNTGRQVMSPQAARLAIGVSLTILLYGLYFLILSIIAVLTTIQWHENKAHAISLEICSLIAITSWILLWRKNVKWTRSRRMWTSVFAGALVLSPLIAIIPIAEPNPTVPNYLPFVLRVVPLLFAALWYSGTAFVWKSSSEEATKSVASRKVNSVVPCPQCSYNLTGLREVRCPECGWTSTIDDVVRRSIDDWAAAADLTV